MIFAERIRGSPVIWQALERLPDFLPESGSQLPQFFVPAFVSVVPTYLSPYFSLRDS